MREKFTKGPWKATYDSQLQAAIEIYNTEDRIRVALLPDRGTVEAMSEIEANANLIAAAPDMYEALEAYVRLERDDILASLSPQELYNEYVECKQKIHKALRKARGETE